MGSLQLVVKLLQVITICCGIVAGQGSTPTACTIVLKGRRAKALLSSLQSGSLISCEGPNDVEVQGSARLSEYVAFQGATLKPASSIGETVVGPLDPSLYITCSGPLVVQAHLHNLGTTMAEFFLAFNSSDTSPVSVINSTFTNLDLSNTAGVVLGSTGLLQAGVVGGQLSVINTTFTNFVGRVQGIATTIGVLYGSLSLDGVSITGATSGMGVFVSYCGEAGAVSLLHTNISGVIGGPSAVQVMGCGSVSLQDTRVTGNIMSFAPIYVGRVLEGDGLPVPTWPIHVRTTRCTVSNNQAFAGLSAGLAVAQVSSLVVADGVFEGNVQKAELRTAEDVVGGAVVALGVGLVVLRNTTFAENQALGTGGAVTVRASPAAGLINISQCVFRGNSAIMGGAIELGDNAAPLSIMGCTFTGNQWMGEQLQVPLTAASAVSIQNQTTWSVVGCSFEQSTAELAGVLTIQDSRGPGTLAHTIFTSNRVTLGGGGCFSALAIQGPLIIDNCTFTACSAAVGGAVFVDASSGCSLVVQGSRFNDCSATGTVVGGNANVGAGGAVHGRDLLSATFNTCTFDQNVATFVGGSITLDSVSGAVDLIRCNFSGSTAGTVGSWPGGGVHVSRVSGSVSVSGCAFSRCSASAGGGGISIIQLQAGSNFRITDTQFQRCTATAGWDATTVSSTSPGTGGAVHVTDVERVEMEGCDFSQCAAAVGGAVYANMTGTLVLRNVSTTNNTGHWDGGAVMCFGARGPLTISNSSFSGNTAVGRIVRLPSIVRYWPEEEANAGDVMMEVTNTTLQGNALVRGGAVLHATSANLALVNVKVLDTTGPFAQYVDFNSDQLATNTTDAAEGYGTLGVAAFVDSIQGVAARVERCSFVNNTGTALYASGLLLEVVDSLFQANDAGPTSFGAAMRVSNTRTHIQHSRFVGNTAGMGGGAVSSILATSLAVSDSWFTNNSATSRGTSAKVQAGALSTIDTVCVTICDSHFLFNSASDTGGAVELMYPGARGAYVACDLCPRYSEEGRRVMMYYQTGQDQGYAVTLTTMSNVTFIGNSVTRDTPDSGGGGGAISIGAPNSMLWLDGLQAHGNTAASGSGGVLSVLRSTTQITIITSSVFTGSYASGNGGAISLIDSPIAFMASNVTMAGNMAGGLGGAISVGYKTEAGLRGCVLANNTAAAGGALACAACRAATLNRTRIEGNVAASGPGGGVFAQDVLGEVVLQESNVASNAAASGGGLYVSAISAASATGTAVTLKRPLLWLLTTTLSHNVASQDGAPAAGARLQQLSAALRGAAQQQAVAASPEQGLVLSLGGLLAAAQVSNAGAGMGGLQASYVPSSSSGAPQQQQQRDVSPDTASGVGGGFVASGCVVFAAGGDWSGNVAQVAGGAAVLSDGSAAGLPCATASAAATSEWADWSGTWLPPVSTHPVFQLPATIAALDGASHTPGSAGRRDRWCPLYRLYNVAMSDNACGSDGAAPTLFVSQLSDLGAECSGPSQLPLPNTPLPSSVTALDRQLSSWLTASAGPPPTISPTCTSTWTTSSASLPPLDWAASIQGLLAGSRPPAAPVAGSGAATFPYTLAALTPEQSTQPAVTGGTLTTNLTLVTHSEQELQLWVELRDQLGSRVTSPVAGGASLISVTAHTLQRGSDVSPGSTELTATARQQGPQLRGPQAVLASQGLASFVGLVVRALPGTYQLTLVAQELGPQVAPALVTVHVLSCPVGTVAAEGGFVCQSCPTSTFSWDGLATVSSGSTIHTAPGSSSDSESSSGGGGGLEGEGAVVEEGACYACPDGADCPGGAVLVPAPGYWHSTANSTYLISCANPDACSGGMPDDSSTNTSTNALVACQVAWYDAVSSGLDTSLLPCQLIGSGWAVATAETETGRSAAVQARSATGPPAVRMQAHRAVLQSGHSNVLPLARDGDGSGPSDIPGLSPPPPSGSTVRHTYYMDLQCAEGYSGNMCAVCRDQGNERWGSSQPFACAPCATRASTVGRALGAFILTLLISTWSTYAAISRSLAQAAARGRARARARRRRLQQLAVDGWNTGGAGGHGMSPVVSRANSRYGGRPGPGSGLSVRISAAGTHSQSPMHRRSHVRGLAGGVNQEGAAPRGPPHGYLPVSMHKLETILSEAGGSPTRDELLAAGSGSQCHGCSMYGYGGTSDGQGCSTPLTPDTPFTPPAFQQEAAALDAQACPACPTQPMPSVGQEHLGLGPGLPTQERVAAAHRRVCTSRLQTVSGPAAPDGSVAVEIVVEAGGVQQAHGAGRMDEVGQQRPGGSEQLVQAARTSGHGLLHAAGEVHLAGTDTTSDGALKATQGKSTALPSVSFLIEKCDETCDHTHSASSSGAHAPHEPAAHSHPPTTSHAQVSVAPGYASDFGRPSDYPGPSQCGDTHVGGTVYSWSDDGGEDCEENEGEGGAHEEGGQEGGAAGRYQGVRAWIREALFGEASEADALKLLVLHLQYLSLILSLPVTFPPSVAAALSLASALTGGASRVYALSCLVDDDRSPRHLAMADVLGRLGVQLFVVLVVQLMWAAFCAVARVLCGAGADGHTGGAAAATAATAGLHAPDGAEVVLAAAVASSVQPPRYHACGTGAGTAGVSDEGVVSEVELSSIQLDPTPESPQQLHAPAHLAPFQHEPQPMAVREGQGVNGAQALNADTAGSAAPYHQAKGVTSATGVVNGSRALGLTALPTAHVSVGQARHENPGLSHVTWRRAALVAFVSSVFTQYSAISENLLRTFTCYPLDDGGSGPFPQNQAATWGRGYWVVDMDEACFTGWHLDHVVPWAVPLTVLLCLGFPLVMLVMLVLSERDSHEPGAQGSTGRPGWWAQHWALLKRLTCGLRHSQRIPAAGPAGSSPSGTGSSAADTGVVYQQPCATGGTSHVGAAAAGTPPAPPTAHPPPQPPPLPLAAPTSGAAASDGAGAQGQAQHQPQSTRSHAVPVGALQTSLGGQPPHPARLSGGAWERPSLDGVPLLAERASGGTRLRPSWNGQPSSHGRGVRASYDGHSFYDRRSPTALRLVQETTEFLSEGYRGGVYWWEVMQVLQTLVLCAVASLGLSLPVLQQGVVMLLALLVIGVTEVLVAPSALRVVHHGRLVSLASLILTAAVALFWQYPGDARGGSAASALGRFLQGLVWTVNIGFLAALLLFLMAKPAAHHWRRRQLHRLHKQHAA